MGWKFQKRIRLLPGITLNLSRKGVSTSIGTRGARVTLGHGKRRTTLGIPGSGISHTSVVPTSNTRRSARSASPAPQEQGVRWRKLVLIALAVCLVAFFVVLKNAWAINKCTGPDGKMSFQDAPCADGKGEALRIRPASGAATTNSAATGEAQARLAKMKQNNEMAEAIRTHQPLVGMTVAQLQDAMGASTKVNADNYNGIQREQVIYERPQETWLVYTRSGVVESIQHRPGTPISRSSTRTAGSCPSPHDIRNAITSASSLALSDAERAERWKAIKAMQACGM